MKDTLVGRKFLRLSPETNTTYSKYFKTGDVLTLTNPKIGRTGTSMYKYGGQAWLLPDECVELIPEDLL